MNHGLFFVPPVHLAAGDYSECSGADVIIITAGARQKTGESRMALVERNTTICRSIVDEIKPYNSTAVLLIVTNPVDVMTQVVIKHFGLFRKSERCVPKGKTIKSELVLAEANLNVLSTACEQAGV